MDVIIVGEDDVCKAIIHRVLKFCDGNISILREMPAKGRVTTLITEFNSLSAYYPVILLTDLDNNGCPPAYTAKLMGGNDKHINFLLSIAVDEAEAWLMADRIGFARYFNVDIDLIPKPSKSKLQGRVEQIEIYCGVKTSWYFMNRILPHSTNKTLIKQMTPNPGATKGPEYNNVMLPFIHDIWDIEAAIENSDSLRSMINRILRLLGEH
jgi:hypothetical protein